MALCRFQLPRSTMKPFHPNTLCAAMALALSTPLWAQERHLEQVTVIANGEEQVEATGGAVVTREDLERLQPRDTAGIFQRESGVSVSGGAQVAQRVYVLGFEQSMLAVTIDGARQPGTAWHHAGNILVDPSFLKRVEVEAGAAAADAGFAAAVGAVRYETVNALDLLQPGQALGARARLGYGSNGTGFTTNLSAYGKSGAVDWLVMGARQNGSDYHDGSGATVLGNLVNSLSQAFSISAVAALLSLLSAGAETPTMTHFRITVLVLAGLALLAAPLFARLDRDAGADLTGRPRRGLRDMGLSPDDPAA